MSSVDLDAGGNQTYEALVAPSGQASIRTVALASLVGTTIEWYDFFIFSSMTALVFNRLFFPVADPLVSTLLSYGTFAVGFVVRPLGGAIFGHFGDKLGRRPLLVITLLMMGLSTGLIGFLPTYAQIGVAAPMFLLALRVVQGLALGGEWGGAVLLAYEHSNSTNRIRYASFPQIGLAIGLCLSTATIALLSAIMSDTAFKEWGWRIPFVASVAILGLGVIIRAKITESPEFARVKAEANIPRVPAAEVMLHHKRTIIAGWLAHSIMGVCFAIYAVYAIPLLVTAGYSRASALAWLAVASLALVFVIPWISGVADRYGARRVYFWAALLNGAAAFPILSLMQYSGSPTVAFLALFAGFGVIWGTTYGPQAGLYCELFEPRLRCTGISLIYQIGSMFSISFTPMIAIWLTSVDGGRPWYVASYVLLIGIVSAIGVTMMPDRIVEDLNAT